MGEYLKTEDKQGNFMNVINILKFKKDDVRDKSQAEIQK